MPDFDESIKRMQKFMRIGEFPSAIREVGLILEVLFKSLYPKLVMQIPAKRKEEILKIEKEIGQDRTVKSFTLGQLIGLFTRAQLFDDVSRINKKKLQDFTPENLYRINDLRNRCTHEGYKPTAEEANFHILLGTNIIKECNIVIEPHAPPVKYIFSIIIASICGLCIILAYYLISSKRIDPLKLERSIVEVVLKDENGEILDSQPGFIVKDEGVIITHPGIVGRREKKRVDIFVRFYNGGYFNVDVGNSKIDNDLEVALLKVDGKDLPSLKIENSDKMRLGDEVVLFGKGDTSEKEIVKGNILGINFIKEKNRNIFQIKVPFCSIGEGAPVLNSRGAVVGLITKIEKQTTSCTVLPSNYFKDIEIETSGESSENWYTKGIFARNRLDWGVALKCFRKAVEIDPKNLEAWLELGGVYFEKKMYDEEVNACQKAVDIDPKNSDARYLLGTAYEDKGLFDLAIKEYQEAVKINPEHKETRESLALLYILKRDKANALKEYEILLKLNEGVAKKIKKLAEMIN
jgi:Tfp pilus assembly protein PilF